ncbi:hypothetical protein HK102_013190 [Quaeritorhiza haematococci]|nr:hypothetical protein HK102_013190 [Quaeritorhiza haematococci]
MSKTLGFLLSLLAAASTVSATPIAPRQFTPRPPGCPRALTIFPGDTCWDIAANNNISLNRFLAANPGINCDNLTVGSQVCLPLPNDDIVVTCVAAVTVQHGDTCWAIAGANGITLRTLSILNPGIDCERLEINSEICVAGSAVA